MPRPRYSVACTSGCDCDSKACFPAIGFGSSAAFPAAMAAKFDAKGLRDEWDRTEALRSKLRAGEPLLFGSLSDFSISRCVSNVDVLTPVLIRSTACGHKRPEVESLWEEVEGLYFLNQRDCDEGHIDDMAWEVRKLLTFIKRKAQRREVSTAPRLIAYISYSCMIACIAVMFLSTAI